jgi:hypothetical protein
MALDNVYISTNNGYKKISAEEAAIHYHNTVTFDSETFVCGTCRQWVTFVNSGTRVPFFRHANSSDDCEDKMIGSASGYSKTNIIGFDLPLKVSIRNKKKLELELGFLPLSDAQMDWAKDNNLSLEVLDNSSQLLLGILKVNHERFSTEKTVYYSIGNSISSRYKIILLDDSNSKNNLKTIWPQTVMGFDNHGTLFSYKDTGGNGENIIGKKVPNRGSVQIGVPYLLFIHRTNTVSHTENIKFDKIACFSSYNLYIIKAIQFNKDTSRFFWQLGYNLTEGLVKICEVWPPCKQSTHIVWHNSEVLYFYKKGNSFLKTYPNIYSSEIVKNTNESALYRILTRSSTAYNTQQFVSAHNEMNVRYVLRYAVLNKKRLLIPTKNTSAQVTDRDDNEISFGTLSKLPRKRILYVTISYDGFVDVIERGIVERRVICKSGEKAEINVDWGSKLVIYQGLDIAGTLEFVRKNGNGIDNDDTLVFKLQRFTGNTISIGHELGRIAIHLEHLPKTKQWLLQHIKMGEIDRMALKYLMQKITRRDK